ncbi:hypothetical protein GCK32_007325, partial [Trichostrongylus colubriformis]
MLLRSACGLFLLFALQAILADDLSCDFRRPCCWQSLEDNKWQIRSGRSININEFRRTFLVGRSRLPPVGNYLLQSRRNGQATFASCSFCSANGVVNVQYRHWQSPTARLKLCWRRLGQQAIPIENCHPAEPSRQSQVISQNLMVPKGIDVQVLFIMEKADGGVNAVVMIDRIVMNVKKCRLTEETNEVPKTRAAMIAVPAASQIIEKKPFSSTSGGGAAKSTQAEPTKVDLSHLALTDDRIRAKLQEREEALKTVRQSIHEIKSAKERKSGEVKSPDIERPGRSTEKIASTGDISAPVSLLSTFSMKRVVPIQPPKRFIPDAKHSKVMFSGGPIPPMPPPSPLAKPEEFDPLTDLLGKELVEFLDPNYVTKDDEEEPDYPDEELETATKLARIQVKHINKGSTTIVLPTVSPTEVQTQSPLHVFNRPLSLVPPHPCSTYGGCLFDRSMCMFTHPPEVPISNYFTRIR